MLENPYAIPGQATSAAPTINHLDADLRDAYTSAWNATVEREWGGTVVLAGSYVGSSGSGFPLLVQENGLGSGRYVGRPSQRLLPNYGYSLTVKNLAHSSYHALQLKADSRQIRRLGLQFGANYTWSHSIDNASATEGETGGFSSGILLDRENLRLDRGNSSFDQTHRFVTHLIWQVPAVRSGSNLVNRLVTGWQASGILSFQTGQPFHLYDLGTPDRDFLFTRPLLTGLLPRTLGAAEMIADPSAPNQFLYLPANLIRKDRSCIANATPFACLGSIYDPLDGTLPRSIYRRPSAYYQDIAFGRIIRLRESAALQLRAEFYNLLNHPNLEVTGASMRNGIDLNRPTFAGGAVGGVVASYGGTSRQVVIAAKILF
jgi:hypothetical protein